jgi:hypothetical protein
MENNFGQFCDFRKLVNNALIQLYINKYFSKNEKVLVKPILNLISNIIINEN